MVRHGALHLNLHPIHSLRSVDHAAPVNLRRICRSQSAPPLPTATPWTARPNGSMMEGKRGSGSSQSTGESSDYSPNSSSPITPFGSSESSLGGMGTLRPSRSQMFENATRVNASLLLFSPPVKVKVHLTTKIYLRHSSTTHHPLQRACREGRQEDSFVWTSA